MGAKGIVWILGAGFSKPLGAPLLSELLTSRSAERLIGVYGNAIGRRVTDFRFVARVYEAGRRSDDATKDKAKEIEWDHAEEFIERVDLACDVALMPILPSRKHI